MKMNVVLDDAQRFLNIRIACDAVAFTSTQPARYCTAADRVIWTSRRPLKKMWLPRSARKELGLTQTEVAEVLGWNQSAVSKMEAGDLLPSLIELENFAVTCGKRLNDFDTWYAQCEEDRVKKALGLPADKFQRRVAAVRRRKKPRGYYGRRKKMPPPAIESPLRPAYDAFQQAIVSAV